VQTESLKLEGEWVEALLQGQRVGHQVVITYRAMVLYEFDRRDPILRDLAIASMLQAGVSGKTVARLSAMSAAHVSGVQRRMDLGGTAALFNRSRAGRFSQVTDAQRETIRLRRLQGASIDTIAKEIQLSSSVVGRVVLALPAPIVQEQVIFPRFGGHPESGETARGVIHGEEKKENLYCRVQSGRGAPLSSRGSQHRASRRRS
jgi:hypothetical protein